jgi:hypothetical protein
MQLLKNLDQALQDQNHNEIQRIDSQIWKIVHSTDINKYDNNFLMEVVGATASTLRSRRAFRQALRWHKELCDLAKTHEPTSDDTVWDYCHYVECLLATGDKHKAKATLDKAIEITSISGTTNSNLFKKFEILTNQSR